MPHIAQKPEVINAPNFWSSVSNSLKPFLGLDYDGTLAPFHSDRTRAHPLPGVPGLLRDINRAGRTCLAVVSGRPLSELMALVGDCDITLVGSHGFEFKYPGRQTALASPASEQAKGLEIAKITADTLDLGHLIEIKAASVALHTRALRANQAARVEGRVLPLWTHIASSHNLHCRRFNGGIEILAQGWNKGHAVLRLLESSHADLPVYIGDDTTDEDVFRVLAGRGIGIRVGRPDAPTAAGGFLPDCEAVRELLKTWLLLDSGRKR